MDERSAATIEFLRARLFSERSISRAAKERADRLAKRVAELEEQLKLVTLQRKKAERAAAQVLSILDSNAARDFSEETYCGSEEDGTPIEPKSQASSNGISISQKSDGGSNAHEKKKHIDQSGELSFPASNAISSTMEHSEKSSHKMNKKERRSADDEKTKYSHMLEVHENEAVGKSGDADIFKDDLTEISQVNATEKDKNISLEVLAPGPLEDQRQENGGSLFSNENGRDGDMERALELQARLIGHNEAEETAQREWEEKFRDNNRCAPDYCEPGNQSDITEESDELREERKNEVREESTESAGVISAHGQVVKSGVEHIWNGEKIGGTVLNRALPTHLDNVYSLDQQSKRSNANNLRLNMSEFPFQNQEKQESELNQKQKLDLPRNSPRENSLHLEHQLRPLFSSSKGDATNLSNAESLGIHNEQQAFGDHEASTGLGGVLEALQLAKVSLNRRLGTSSLTAQSRPAELGREIPALAIEGGDASEIPIKSDGLFRVPSSSQFKVASDHTRFLANFPDSRSVLAGQYHIPRVRVASEYHSESEMPITSQIDASTHPTTRRGYYPDPQTSLTRSYLNRDVGFSSDRFANLEIPSSPQLEGNSFQRNMLKTYPDSRSITGRYYPYSEAVFDAANSHGNSEMGLELSNRRSLTDPYNTIGIGSSVYNRYSNSSYEDHISRMPVSDEYLRNYASMGSVMPDGDRRLPYDGQFGWKMDRR
ncbi:hypothetical protein Syun_028385 [Stephania yunnanensis]|uniref:Uncharacterized protein n=1 Tax=Stephania yunnanensis TaxID=152371 RepID=A0AAP0ER71_9MAGN